jgi:hypothetical protein
MEIRMKARNLVAVVAVLATGLPVLVFAADTAPAGTRGPTAAAQGHTAAAVAAPVANTRAALRDLWLGHIFWVRNVVDARIAGDADRAKVAEQQVVANATALAGSIEPYYGKAASDKLFELLAGHWGAISGYLDAARGHQDAGKKAALDKLTANAGQIATFLSSANPHWPADTVRGLFAAHGAHHVQQIDQLVAHQYAQEAQTWAAMKDHMYVIADALTDGLVAQFPDKFR